MTRSVPAGTVRRRAIQGVVAEAGRHLASKGVRRLGMRRAAHVTQQRLDVARAGKVPVGEHPGRGLAVEDLAVDGGVDDGPGLQQRADAGMRARKDGASQSISD